MGGVKHSFDLRTRLDVKEVSNTREVKSLITQVFEMPLTGGVPYAEVIKCHTHSLRQRAC